MVQKFFYRSIIMRGHPSARLKQGRERTGRAKASDEANLQNFRVSFPHTNKESCNHFFNEKKFFAEVGDVYDPEHFPALHQDDQRFVT